MRRIFHRTAIAAAALGLLTACGSPPAPAQPPASAPPANPVVLPPGEPAAGPGPASTMSITYLDTVPLGDVHYLALPSRADRAPTPADLGSEVVKVKFQVAGSQKPPTHATGA